MKYNVICRKVELSDSRKEKLLAKLKKLDKFFDEDLECKVLVSEQKTEIVMEITIINKGFILRAEARDKDLISAADECLSNLDRQIRKHKTKLAKHLHRPVIEEYASIVESSEPVADDSADFKIIKVKKVESKPMSAEEAVLQMNMIGHDFFIFLNPDTQKDNIVYRRKDGNYGLIETE
jgi:putative sigma-54 modulation protein